MAIIFRMFECLVTCLLRVTVLLLCWLQTISKIKITIYPCLIISEGRLNCLTFWLAQQRKPDMLPNINTCENWYWYFSENLRIVALKLLELTQFASPNLSIYFNFVWCWGPLWCWYFLTNRSCAVHHNSESLCTVFC